MNEFLRNAIHKEYLISYIFVAFYLFGVVFHILPQTEKAVLRLTEPTLFLSNGIIIFFLFLNHKKKTTFFFWFLLTVISTLIIEILGITTGKIFGSYLYGKTMALKIFAVPIIIGINWAILILASYQFASRIPISKNLKPFISGIFIVLFDFFMEPVAIKLDYWRWENNVIPIQNYLVWFLLTVLFSFLLTIMKLTIKSKILAFYFIIQFLFFVILNISFF